MNHGNGGNGGGRQSTIQEFIETLASNNSSKKRNTNVIKLVVKPQRFIRHESKANSIQCAVDYANKLDW